MKHLCPVQICLDDLAQNISGREAVEMVFDLIEKCKAAVQAKSGRVLSFAFDNVPSFENPRGDIATLSFAIGTPYDCAAKLDVQHYLLPLPYSGESPAFRSHKSFPLVNFEVTFPKTK